MLLFVYMLINGFFPLLKKTLNSFIVDQTYIMLKYCAFTHNDSLIEQYQVAMTFMQKKNEKKQKNR